MSHFLPVREVQRVAGGIAGAVLPDEVAETWPIPVRVDGAVLLLVMFYWPARLSAGTPDRPPHYAAFVDGETGKIVRFQATTPQALGIRVPVHPVPGVTAAVRVADHAHEAKENRFFELSPLLWAAYAGRTGVTPEVRAAAREYNDLFRSLVTAGVAPFYVDASPDYFRWLEDTAGK